MYVELRKDTEKTTQTAEGLSSYAVTTINSKFPNLHKDQLKAIQMTDGPLQIIAGPGSGKTLVLVLRALYLLLSGKAKPCQVMLSTFTEKAAAEIRDRLRKYAESCGYKGPIYEMRIGTFNSLCNEIIQNSLHHTALKRNYEVLDEITQNLFLNAKFTEVITEQMKFNNMYFGRWTSERETIRQLISYFNKISQELIDVQKLVDSNDQFLMKIAEAYENYTRCMYANNRIDFEHQQKIVYELLQRRELENKIKDGIKYILVDEYQDTSYVQEEILLQLAHPSNNICIVGDEDQSLYRFRGATPRNILEFHTHFQYCHKIVLNVNYRSHRNIINIYNHFMNSIDWSNPNGDNFRFEKCINADPCLSFSDYPAVFSIQGTTKQDEGSKFALLVKYLKDNSIIEDYSDVALILHSVKKNTSKHYIDALDNLHIPYFAPRAKRFFENEEVQLMIGCYALLFNFREYAPIAPNSSSFASLRNYIDGALVNLRLHSHSILQLEQYIQRRKQDIGNLRANENSHEHIIDFFYELLEYRPFSSFMENEVKARNLAKFSKLLETFQNFQNMQFFSFLNFLMDLDIFDDYQDPSDLIPKGYVQIMTMHQSKGLEFPVVVVGSLDKKSYSNDDVDKDLGRFYNRVEFEPEDRISEFDSMRQYYVAFSRAIKILVLTTTNHPNDLISSIWNGMDQWPYISESLCKEKFKSKSRFIPKRSYSLTPHINTFEVCPKKYQFYVEYEFSPSRSVGTFGNLVHQTLEEIHKMILNGRLGDITNEMIRDELFEPNYRSLISTGMQRLSDQQKKTSLDHIVDYFNQNYDNLRRVVDAELEISVEKPGYILTGKIDLLLEGDGKFEILDFKTEQRPREGDPILERYFKQLHIYANILKERYGTYPQKLYIYWTSEPDRDQALMEVPFNNNDAVAAADYFDGIVNAIRRKDFEIKRMPEAKVCRECDFRRSCVAKGLISLRQKH